MDWITSKIRGIDTTPSYILRNSPHGFAAIVYVEDENTPYGRADFKLAKNMWETLDFIVKEIRNPTDEELNFRIREMKENIINAPNKHDLFSLTFIGHGGLEGGKEFIKLKDGMSYTLTTLYAEFTSSKCPGLAAKPKLFFIQACRDQKEEERTEVDVYNTADEETISEHCDSFILLSSYPGTKSYYSATTGESPFIKSLCYVFERDFKNHDIDAMVHKVKRAVSGKNFSGKTVTVTSIDTLLKKLKLHSSQGTTSLPEYCQTFRHPETTDGLHRSAEKENPSKVNIKLKCDKAVENAVKSYDEEMQIKVKSSKTEEDLQKFDKPARVDANKKYKAVVSFAIVNELELCEAGLQKLKRALGDKFEKYRKIFNAHKLKCGQAIENDVKSYDEEMQIKLKSSKTEEELQKFDEAARVDANEKYEDDVAFAIVNDFEIYDEGHQKLNKALNDKFEKNRKNFNAHKELYNAAEAGDVKGVEAALLYKPDINWENPNEDGITPLITASQKGHAAVVEKLVDSGGADVNKATNAGVTPLWTASRKGHAAVVEKLVNSGADVNKASYDGQTPLKAARYHKRRDWTAVVKILEKAGGRE